ncbi:MAG TPA: hypothetical protein VIR16_00120 [Candidatus Limnocylindrales bacterium]
MGRITIDEYYLTEQDEPRVRLQLGAQGVAARRPRQTATASGAHGPRPRRGIRRRLRAIRRAAGLILTA